MKEIINSKNAPQPIGPYNQAVEFNNMIFISGQLGIDVNSGKMADDLKDQTKQVLENIKSILEDAELNMQHIVKTTCYLKNMDDFKAMNEVYATFFTDKFPARAAFEVSRLPLDALVEIECVAARF